MLLSTKTLLKLRFLKSLKSSKNNKIKFPLFRQKVPATVKKQTTFQRNRHLHPPDLPKDLLQAINKELKVRHLYQGQSQEKAIKAMQQAGNSHQYLAKEASNLLKHLRRVVEVKKRVKARYE